MPAARPDGRIAPASPKAHSIEREHTMTDAISLQQPAPAALAQYRSLLVPPIDAYSALVPLDALPALELKIEASFKPAHPREVAMAVAALGASLKIPPTIEDPEQFGKAMEFDLAALEYPADILQEAVVSARRTLDWYPSIKEMIAICEQLIEPRRKQRRAIRQMEAEHHRRQQEAAERKAQAELESKREIEREKEREAHQRRLRDLELRVRERFGNDALLPGDLELADYLLQTAIGRQWSTVAASPSRGCMHSPRASVGRTSFVGKWRLPSDPNGLSIKAAFGLMMPSRLPS